MKRVYPAMLIVALTLSALEVTAAPPAETGVQTAIDNFTPLWSPPRGELAGWIVALDPGDEAPLATDQRLDDDLSLLTAGHLYHLIHGAGGGVVLLRSDDTLSTSAGSRRQTQRFDAARTRNCDVCLVVRYVPGSTEASAGAGGDRPRDTQLSDALRAALGASRESTVPASVHTPVAPAMCLVELPRPPAMTSIDASVRRACFENSRRLYAGIRAYCAQARALSASAASSPTDLNGDTPDVRGPATSPGRKLWPAGRLADTQADWFCRLFGQVFITGSSLMFFDVSAVVDDGVTLCGSTNVPLVARGLAEALCDVGVDHVHHDIRALPDRGQLGERLFGVCRAPMALTYARPGNKGGRQTQILYGEPLFLLDRRDGCYLLLAGDGYWGWTDDTAVEPLTTEQFDAYFKRPAAVVQRDITREGVFIPRGARVRLADAGTAEPRILLPGGTALTAPADTLRIDTPDDGAARRVAAALELLYVPYVFGGRSPLGLDCSGLVSSASMRDGRTPARDVWQQAFAGQLVATAWHRTNIRLGDQLFFVNSSGKLYHTAIALDATRFVHSSPPGVHISSLDPQDRLYDEEWGRTFFMAKRP